MPISAKHLLLRRATSVPLEQGRMCRVGRRARGLSGGEDGGQAVSGGRGGWVSRYMTAILPTRCRRQHSVEGTAVHGSKGGCATDARGGGPQQRRTGAKRRVLAAADTAGMWDACRGVRASDAGGVWFVRDAVATLSCFGGGPMPQSERECAQLRCLCNLLVRWCLSKPCSPSAFILYRTTPRRYMLV